MSAVPNLQDMRKHIRYDLEGDKKSFLPGTLATSSDKKIIEYSLIDYSAGGLGIKTTRQLLPDLEYTLIVSKTCKGNEDQSLGNISFSLVWGMTLQDGSGSFRYGLKATNGLESLKKIFDMPD